MTELPYKAANVNISLVFATKAFPQKKAFKSHILFDFVDEGVGFPSGNETPMMLHVEKQIHHTSPSLSNTLPIAKIHTTHLK